MQDASPTLTIEDAPSPPAVVRLNLRSRSLWEKIQAKAKQLEPTQMLAFFRKEQEKILRNVKERGHITDDERELLNAILANRVDEVMNRFKKEMNNMLAIKSDDDPDTIILKSQVGGDLLVWLDSLVAWLMQKLRSIFEAAKAAFQWCVDKVSELFAYLYSLFEGN